MRYRHDGRHVEADLTKQVLAEIEPGGRVHAIYTMSSGKPSTPTVIGRFSVYSKTPGTNTEGMVDSNYFIRGYAIHGYAEVPTYAASHGCLRVPIPNAPAIYALGAVRARPSTSTTRAAAAARTCAATPARSGPAGPGDQVRTRITPRQVAEPEAVDEQREQQPQRRARPIRCELRRPGDGRGDFFGDFVDRPCGSRSRWLAACGRLRAAVPRSPSASCCWPEAVLVWLTANSRKERITIRQSTIETVADQFDGETAHGPYGSACTATLD